MDSFFDAFRANVKYYREQGGMNQSELAIQANSSNGMIGNIESGKAHPSFKMIISLAEALKVHPADLFLRDASKSRLETKEYLKSSLKAEIDRILERDFC